MSTDGTPQDVPQTVEEARERIAADRAQLEETVEELAARADVSGRAKAKAQELKEEAATRTQDEDPRVLAAAGGALLLVLLLLRRRRRRRRRRAALGVD